MAKKECPSCGIEIDNKETICPVCQYEFPIKRNYHIKVTALIFIIIFLIQIIKFITSLFK